MLYAPGSVFDNTVEERLAAGIIIVADEDDEPVFGADTGMVKTNSPACQREIRGLVNSTFCNTTEEIVRTS